jgi:hypothetical protein
MELILWAGILESDALCQSEAAADCIRQLRDEWKKFPLGVADLELQAIRIPGGTVLGYGIILKEAHNIVARIDAPRWEPYLQSVVQDMKTRGIRSMVSPGLHVSIAIAE